MSLKKKFVMCRSILNRRAVRHEQRGGVDHIVVQSATLPDNVVMNSGLYPAEEIAKSYIGLERTLAPLGHPENAEGSFLPASDPEAINNYHVGAWNENVRRHGGRVFHDIVINVDEANSTERGRRLLARIDELETNEQARPIHTSTGLFLEVEPVKTPMTNAAGDEYTWIARNMVFDHNAILLDVAAAATPEQGVGMAVNSSGGLIDADTAIFESNAVKAARGLPLAPSGYTWDKAAAIKRVRAEVGAEEAPNAAYGRYHLWIDAENSSQFGAYKLPFVDIIDGVAHAVPAALRNAAARLGQTQGPSDAEKTRIKGIIDSYLSEVKTNQGMSYSDLRSEVMDALERSAIDDDAWVEEIYDTDVIICTERGLFSVPYRLDNGRATIVGIPTPVDRVVTYTPVTNEKGTEAMKDLILNALKDAKVETEGLDEAALLAKYNELQANQTGGGRVGEGGETSVIAEAVANALKPLTEKLDSLEVKINEKDEGELNSMAELVANSDKFPGIDKEAALGLPADTLRKMAANCGTGFAVPFSVNMSEGDQFSVPSEMPN